MPLVSFSRFPGTTVPVKINGNTFALYLPQQANYIIQPLSKKMVFMGVKLSIEDGYYVELRLFEKAAEKGIALAEGVKIILPNSDENIILNLINPTQKPIDIAEISPFAYCIVNKNIEDVTIIEKQYGG
jgi:dUTPase